MPDSMNVYTYGIVLCGAYPDCMVSVPDSMNVYTYGIVLCGAYPDCMVSVPDCLMSILMV